MIIYGVALLSVCMLAGLSLGSLLGAAIGVQANVGGVGIAMLLLILLADRFRDKLNPGTANGRGVLFWSAMYIPVVVAMAARQNVIGALTGGTAAILAGVASVATGYLMVFVFSRLIKPKRNAHE